MIIKKKTGWGKQTDSIEMEADVKGTVTNVTNSRYDYLLKKKSDEYKVVQEEERKKVTNQFEEERKLEELKHKHKMQILMLWLGFFSYFIYVGYDI